MLNFTWLCTFDAGETFCTSSFLCLFLCGEVTNWEEVEIDVRIKAPPGGRCGSTWSGSGAHPPNTWLSIPPAVYRRWRQLLLETGWSREQSGRNGDRAKSEFRPMSSSVRALGSQSGVCVATYSGRLEVARVYIGQCSSSTALWSCSADAVFILGTWYLNLRVLRLCAGEVCCKRTCHQRNPSKRHFRKAGLDPDQERITNAK